MSLLDSLLLDPHPFNVWIARRTDGVKGSGTASDPYDGGTATRLDGLLNSIPASTYIHLGPGVFETNGYAEGETTGWQPRTGMKIEGSGIGVTTLKLVNANSTDKHYFAIGHALGTGSSPVQPNRMDFFEVSDLTIDCNLANNGSVACGAVRVMGNHCRIARVKAINWGTKTLNKPCYVIAVTTADLASNVTEVIDPGIEDCIVVQPGSSVSGGKVTLLHAGGKDDTATDVESYGQAPFIRNCFADCLPVPSGSPDLSYDYRGLSMGWCRAGIVEGNQIHNMKVGGPYQSGATTRDLVVRNNSYRNVVRGPFWDLGTVYPASPVALVSLDRDLTFDSSGKTAVAITDNSPSVAHPYQPGDRVKIDTDAVGFTPYEGTFVIKDAPAPNKFRYVMASDPGGAATAPSKHQKVFGAGKILVEGNSIALAASGGLLAIHCHDQQNVETTPSNVFGDVIVRRNRIRYVDGLFDPAWTGDGIKVSGAKNVILQDNAVKVAPANPVRSDRCGAVSHFDNRAPDGALIARMDPVTGRPLEELDAAAEDVFITACYEAS